MGRHYDTQLPAKTYFCGLTLALLVLQNLHQFRRYFRQQLLMASSGGTTSMKQQPQDRVLASSAPPFVHADDFVNDILDHYWSSRSRDGTVRFVTSNTQPEKIDDDTSIRSRGCNVTDTPFIFVHIGKARGERDTYMRAFVRK